MTTAGTSEGTEQLALGVVAITPDESTPESGLAESSSSDAESQEESNEPGEDTLWAEELAFAENPVAVVETEGLSAMGEAAAARGYLWIALPKPGPQHRGRLGLFIEESIESSLDSRGALAPGIQASTGLDASLSDQLYRARLVEMRGIALGIPSLEGITNLARALDAEDSAVLRWWMAATADRPVRLVVSDENTRLRVYPSPVLFDTLFEVAPGPVTPLPPSPSMAQSSESMDLSDLPPAVEEEHQTNVLGTEVESLASSPSEEDFGLDSLFPGDDEDVDLSELDRALGLQTESAPAPEVAATVKKTRATTPKAKTEEEISEHDSHQLALDYESSEPPRAQTICAQPAPAPEERSVDAKAPVVVSTPLPNGASDEEPEVPEEEATLDAATTEETVLCASEDPREEASATDDASEGLDAEGLDDDGIDADEFLKTLEEDSARAPVVSEAEPNDEDVLGARAELSAALAVDASNEEAESSVSAIEEVESEEKSLTPLPTKKLSRNPFIRMADPAEAVSEDQAAAIDSETPEETDSNSATEPDSVAAEMTPAGAEAQQEALEASESAPESSESALEPSPSAADSAPLESSTAAEASPADMSDPFNQLAAREWKSWVTNLEAARGPKPLSVIERMFVTDYTRLREAVRRGVAGDSANAILDEWQESFTTSYSEAFDALRVRGKRPTMVLDLPELASRLGRLQGAKRVQLLMVDGLRFDLGLMVQDRMRKRAAASLTERLLLWSALPTKTSYQLELLGKGPEGLKQEPEADEPPALVARGRAARTPRRMRTGTLELFKLDVVEDELRQSGAPVVERMDSIADATADALVEHLAKQSDRTMVVVFGDHGFALDPNAAGTTEEVTQGGASPEEVLVPAFAWLTGAVH